jgi:hypothetical protein
LRRIRSRRIIIANGLFLSIVAAPTTSAKKDKTGKADRLLLAMEPPPISESERTLTDLDYAPSAPAVVLVNALQKEVYELEFVKNTYLRRIKILTDEGIERYSVFEYNIHSSSRVQQIRARTILPDGTEIDATGNLEHDPKEFGTETLRIAFPEVQVGAILELFVRMNSNSFFVKPWIIQEFIPVVESRFILIPDPHQRYSTVPAGLPRELNTPQVVSTAKRDAFVWQFVNVSPLAREANMPPTGDVAKRLYVRLMAHEDPKHFTPISSSWKEWNQWRTAQWDEWMKRDTAAAKKLARDVVSVEMAPLAKAEAIRQTLSNSVEFKGHDVETLHGSADDVLSSGTGTSADLAATTVVMLRAVDVDAYLAETRMRSHGSIPKQFPVPALFDDTLVCVRDAEGELFYSPASDLFVGAMNYDHAGVVAIVYDDKSEEPTILPDFSSSQNHLTRVATIRIDEDGNLSAESRHTYHAVAATALRHRLEQLDDFARREYMETRLRSWVDNAAVTAVDIATPESDDGDLVVTCEWNAPGYATISDEGMLINPHLFSRVSIDDWAPNLRTSFIHLGGTLKTIDTTTLLLPDNVNEVTLPEDVSLDLENVGIFSQSYTRTADGVVAERRLTLDRFSFRAEAFRVLKDWFSPIAQSDGQSIELTVR